MKQRIPLKDCGKGVNKDLPAYELELGMWSDSTANFRFRNGFAEKWDGVSTLFSGAGSFTPYWMQLMSLPNGGSTDIRIVVYAGTKAYYRNTSGGGSDTNISRGPAEQTVSSNTRIGANTAEVTTSANHNLTTGDTIIPWGFTESGYNETSAVAITKMSNTVFRYTTTNAIGANATVMGSYSVITSAGTDAFTGNENWSGGVLNGNLIMGNPLDGLFYWPKAGILRKFPFTSYKSYATFVFGNYIVQLATYEDSAWKLNRVRWSNAAIAGGVPTTFTPANTNDARYEDLNGAARLTAGKQLREAAYVYSRDGCYSMRYIAGSLVFKFDRIDDYGCVGPLAVANTPKGQVFLTPSLDIRIHNGGASESIAEGRIRSELVQSSDLTSKIDKTILVPNYRKNELWVIVRSSTGNKDKILAWAWDTGIWSIFNVAPNNGDITAAAEGIYPGESVQNEQNFLLVANSSAIGVAGGLTAGTGIGQWYGNSITGTLERTGMHFDDPDRMRAIERSRWNIDATAAVTATIYHGSAKTADATPSYSSGGTYTVGTTDYVNQRATMGRFGAIKLTTTAYPFNVRSADLEATLGGTR